MNILTSGMHLKAEDTIAGRWPYGYCNSVDVNSQYLFMANGSAVQIYDISTKASPVKISEVTLEGPINRVKYYSNHLYVVTDVGFYIVDVSVLNAPQQVYAVTSEYGAINVLIEKNYAVVAYWNKVKIYDISDPANPVEHGSFATTSATGLAVYGDHLYYTGFNEIGILDMNDIDSIKQITAIDTLTSSQNIAINYPYVYIAQYKGVRVLDVSDPENPFQTDFLTLDNTLARCVYYDSTSSRLLCTDYRKTYLYNATSGDHPVLISKYSTDFHKDLVYHDGFAYIAMYQYGMQIVDYSVPTNPVQVSKLVGANEISDLRVKGNILYAAGEGFPIEIIDISDISNPSTSDTINYPSYKLWLRDNELFINSFNGFRIYDITTPETPSMVLDYHDFSESGGKGLWVEDTLVYVVDQSSGLDIVDIADYSSPVKIGSLNHQLLTEDICKDGNTIYMTDYDSTLRIVDVTDPTHPVETDSIKFNEKINGLARKDSLLFTGGTSKVYALDISDTILPQLKYSVLLNSFNGIYDLSVDSNYLYIVGWKHELAYVDISGFPSIDEYFVKIYDESSSLYIDDQNIFVGQYYSGVTILDKSVLSGTDTAGSGNTGINQQQTIASAYTLSPNPCKDFIEIRSNDAGQPGGAFRITFYDIQGRICKSVKLSNSGSNPIISVADFSPGIYIYRIEGKNRIITGKIAKEEY